jgi:hypothetical protein
MESLSKASGGLARKIYFAIALAASGGISLGIAAGAIDRANLSGNGLGLLAGYVLLSAGIGCVLFAVLGARAALRPAPAEPHSAQ